MKVDVLAVLDVEAQYLNECGIVRGLCPSELERFANLVNARAAIAELIEAASDCNEWLCRTSRKGTAHQQILAAALAKVSP